MRKILFVACDNLGLGGIQSVIMSIVRNLKNDYIFDIVVFDRSDTHFEKEFENQGQIFYVPCSIGGVSIKDRMDFYIRGWRIYHSIKKIINKNGPYDAIHCNNYFEEGLVLKAAKDSGIAIRIAHSHSCPPSFKGKYIRKAYEYFYRRLILKYATDLIACSKAAGYYLFNKYDGVNIIENSIDLTKFKPSDGSDNKRVPAWSFIHVGRWGDVKNQVFLIEVFASIHKLHSGAKLTLVGYGADTDLKRIYNKIDEYNLRDSILFYPGDSDIPELLERNNVFLFPSKYEGLGIVLIEAQAMSLKCFASTAVPEEANLGFVDYLPLDADIWAEKVMAHVDEHGAERYHVNMESYDIQNIVHKYRTLYSGGGKL